MQLAQKVSSGVSTTRVWQCIGQQPTRDALAASCKSPTLVYPKRLIFAEIGYFERVHDFLSGLVSLAAHKQCWARGNWAPQGNVALTPAASVPSPQGLHLPAEGTSDTPLQQNACLTKVGFNQFPKTPNSAHSENKLQNLLLPHFFPLSGLVLTSLRALVSKLHGPA